MTTAGYNIAGGQGPVAAHSHRPTPAALKLVGDALWCAGVVPCDASVLNPSNRVRVHFDVGTDYPTYSGATTPTPSATSFEAQPWPEAESPFPKRYAHRRPECQFPGIRAR